MLFGGHVADRRDRRSIILVTGSLLVVGTLALALMSLQPRRSGWAGSWPWSSSSASRPASSGRR